LIDAGAAVDEVNNDGWTALVRACDRGRHECAQALVDAQADLELTNRDGRNAFMIACQRSYSYQPHRVRQGKILCALALLEAMTPIREADSPDRVAVLKYAGERLQLIEAVLATRHVVEDAPSLASVGALTAEAQGVFVNFASHMLAIAKLP
jgi:ankyrin repeat protein